MMNRVVLVGRLTKNPELKHTQSGTAVCAFTIAVNRPFSKEQEADFINVVAWKKTAENVATFLKKGALIGVDGRIQTRSYESDGRKVYVTEVIGESVAFLEPKQEKKSEYGGFRNDPSVGGIDVSDDDLPF